MKTINPHSEEVITEYSYLSDEELNSKLEKGHISFHSWSKKPIKERIGYFEKLAAKLRQKKSEYAHLMSEEMGKLVNEGEAEIEKCALLCDYYAEVAEKELQPKVISSSHQRSEVHYCPQGIIFAIMPWNYPFWQVLRFAVPTLISGNVAVLKHAENVCGCAQEIEKLFLETGFLEGTFQNLFISHDQSESVIKSSFVRGVTLTGSTKAGQKVASLAGSHIKKSVLELGGSDANIVLADADIQMAVKKLIQSRLLNAGQSCIAAKRFIVDRKIEEEFLAELKKSMSDISMGDPKDKNSQMGPMARKDLRDNLHQQVQDSIEQGAKLELGGEVPNQPGFYYPPTILSGVKSGMRAYDEELFGPVASVISFDSIDEAIEIANSSRYGLGGAIFSRDEERAFNLAVNRIDAGSCFVNEFVKSDPKLPFGGVKDSGYGREMSTEGLKEFVNIKTVCIR